VWSAKISDDAAKAVSASADFTVYRVLSLSSLSFRKLWDTYTGETLQTFAHEHMVRSADISSSQTLVASGGQEKRVRVFEVEHPKSFSDIGTHQGVVKSVVWNRTDLSDRTIVTSGDDKRVIWWDTRSPNPLTEYATKEMITSLELSVDRRFITLTAGKSILIFDTRTYQCPVF